ncbi:hypothetical protein ACG2F4_15925 [Halalkalibaculum sp. DA3122]|uniref:hypothetical protein n=1 Tax=Halalkalibaculum sp. DA3122 TaxID=3373607 RepID=UPI00375487C4
MGQQQILLVILVTVIVAVATIIAIDTLQESRKSANEDAVQQDILLILGEAQAYYFRNASLQGGGRSFDNIGIGDISIGDSTANGTYAVSGSGNTLTVEGTGTDEGVFLRAIAELQGDDFQVQWEYEE